MFPLQAKTKSNQVRLGQLRWPQRHREKPIRISGDAFFLFIFSVSLWQILCTNVTCSDLGAANIARHLLSV